MSASFESSLPPEEAEIPVGTSRLRDLLDWIRSPPSGKSAPQAMAGHRERPDPHADWADDSDFERGYRAGRQGGHGNVQNNNGHGKLTAWILVVFASVISILLGFVLNAVYSNNGDVRELKGQVNAMQIQINNLANGRSGVMRGSP